MHFCEGDGHELFMVCGYFTDLVECSHGGMTLLMTVLQSLWRAELFVVSKFGLLDLMLI